MANNRLREEQIWEIYKSRKSAKELAYDYGIGLTTIYNIKNKKIYRDILAYHIIRESKALEANRERKNETNNYKGEQ